MATAHRSDPTQANTCCSSFAKIVPFHLLRCSNPACVIHLELPGGITQGVMQQRGFVTACCGLGGCNRTGDLVALLEVGQLNLVGVQDEASLDL